MKVSKRQLAARFVDALGDQPVGRLAQGLIAAAGAAGYSERDVPALIAAIEYELRRRYGAVEVQLTTAHKTSDATLDEIAAVVAKAADAQHFSYVHHIDPELIGGYEATASGVAVRDSIRFNLTNSGGSLG